MCSGNVQYVMRRTNVMAAQGVVADAISDSETAFQAEIEFQGYHV